MIEQLDARQYPNLLDQKAEICVVFLHVSCCCFRDEDRLDESESKGWVACPLGEKIKIFSCRAAVVPSRLPVNIL